MVKSHFIRIILMPILLTMGMWFVVPWGRAGVYAKKARPLDKLEAAMNGIGVRYVKLALALGEHDPLYVDAYYGPQEWQIRAKKEKKPLGTIDLDAVLLLGELKKLDESGQGEIVRLRRTFLIKQLESLVARTRMLSGARYTFDEETKALYDVVAPPFDENDIKAKLARIDSLLPPGEGSLGDRFERFQKNFIIMKDKVAAVFMAAITEARRRTRRHIALPENESFALEFITNKSWRANSAYKGNYRSVIQINTDMPFTIDAPVYYACHEGYPGHHIRSVMFEQCLVKERGWVEFTVSPLFSPLSPIDEGCADYCIKLVFPAEERLSFERDILYPMAGLDPEKAAPYDSIMKLVQEISSTRIEAARRYLSKRITAEDAAQFLHSYVLMSLARAHKYVTFIDQYRSYLINYSVGYDLVKEYIEKEGGMPDHPERRWDRYAALISVPRVPSEWSK